LERESSILFIPKKGQTEAHITIASTPTGDNAGLVFVYGGCAGGLRIPLYGVGPIVLNLNINPHSLHIFH